MPRSMTGYARAKSKELEGLSWTVELLSVNRKGLDIHMHLSRELLFLDMEVRKLISSHIHRGQVTVKIQLSKGKESISSLPLLKKLKRQFEKMAKELHLPTEEITLPFLLMELDRLSLEEEIGPKIQIELKKTVEQALKDLIKMKEVEGKELCADISKRLKTLSVNTDTIEKENEKSPEKYRKKLTERLSQIFAEGEMDERVLKEVALFAEKVDITEEITRLKSHIKQTADLLRSKEESIGKNLDFLTQEMLREVNTIASKSPALRVTQLAIASKVELEKIREQIQNIE